MSWQSVAGRRLLAGKGKEAAFGVSSLPSRGGLQLASGRRSSVAVSFPSAIERARLCEWQCRRGYTAVGGTVSVLRGPAILRGPLQNNTISRLVRQTQTPQRRLAHVIGAKGSGDDSHWKGGTSRLSAFSPWRRFFIQTLKIFGIVHLVHMYVLEVSRCGGASMLPVLSVDGDYVLHLRLPFYRAIEHLLPDDVVGHEGINVADKYKPVKKAAIGGPRGKVDPAMGTGLRVGDLIVAISPLEPSRLVCKRVIGLAGDTILIDPRIDPEPWHKTTWHSGHASQKPIEMRNLDDKVKARILATSDHFDSTASDAVPQYIVVPKGHVWVGGENMASSRDSRHYGPIALGLVQGRAIARIFPGPKWLSNTLRPLPHVSAPLTGA